MGTNCPCREKARFVANIWHLDTAAADSRDKITGFSNCARKAMQVRCKLAIELGFMRPLRMRVYLQVLMFSICLSSESLAQRPVPTSTYTLHAYKEPRPWSLGEIPLPPSTVLAITPAGALLVLIPQPERKWLLKELIGWSTLTPKEKSLAVGGSHVGPDEDVWITGDLTVSRDGRYVVVRITTRRRLSKPDVFDVEASVTVVDLNTFSIRDKRTTTDPLIAGAQWFLTKDNLLVSNAITGLPRTNQQSTSAVTENYHAAVLDLPDLKSAGTCSYTKFLEFDGSRWRTEEEKTTNVKCAAVLQAANVETVNDLPGENGLVVKLAKELHAPSNCSITNVSDDQRFALYDCSEGHQAWDAVITTSRSLLVLSTANSTAALSIALRVKQPTVATLATADNQQYLILVREGIKVEAYRVP